MKRSVYALVAGLALWVLVVSLLNRGLRIALPGYPAAEPTLTFTLGMKVARLILGALASLAAGATAGWIAPAKKGVPWLLGAIILAAFIPIHVQLWAKFPVWYHLVFLGTLVPLVGLGAKLRPQATGNRQQVREQGTGYREQQKSGVRSEETEARGKSTSTTETRNDKEVAAN